MDAFVNSTGLMWENGEAFGAYLLWAEHRYYGESFPTPPGDDDTLDPVYLSHEQALADYAAVLTQTQADLAASLANMYPGCSVSPGTMAAVAATTPAAAAVAVAAPVLQ